MKYCYNLKITTEIFLGKYSFTVFRSGSCESDTCYLFPYKALVPVKRSNRPGRSLLNRTGSSLIAEYTNSAQFSHFNYKCKLSAPTKKVVFSSY